MKRSMNMGTTARRSSPVEGEGRDPLLLQALKSIRLDCPLFYIAEPVRSDHPLESIHVPVKDAVEPLNHGLHGLELDSSGSTTEVAAVASSRVISAPRKYTLSPSACTTKSALLLLFTTRLIGPLPVSRLCNTLCNTRVFGRCLWYLHTLCSRPRYMCPRHCY